METTVPVFENIWLADDDFDDCEFFLDVLKQILPSASVTILRDVNELMQLLDRGDKPDILFLDMLMPAKNGLDCLLDIRAKPHLKALPIVALSGSLSEKHIHLAYDSGANLFYTKPASLPELATGLTALFKLDWNDPDAVARCHYVNECYVPFSM